MKSTSVRRAIVPGIAVLALALSACGGDSGGDGGEGALGFFERARLEREERFASAFCALHNAGAFKDAQVLGDRLPSDVGACGQLRDRLLRTVGELGDDLQARAVAERREEGGAFQQASGGSAATTFRHTP